MHIGGGQAAVPVDRLAIPTIAGFGQNQRGKRGVALRIMEGMPGQPAFRQVDELRAEGGQALLHDRAAGQQAAEAMGDTGLVHDFLEQAHHAAAFGQQGFAGVDVGMKCRPQRCVGTDGFRMQFG